VSRPHEASFLRATALAVLALLGPACVPTTGGGVKDPQTLEKADELFLLEQYPQAIAQYEAFLAANPGASERPRVLAQIGKCHLGAGRPGEAIRSFDQALSGDEPSSEIRCDVTFRRGVAYRMQGDAARAVESFRAVAAAPAGARLRVILEDEFHYEFALALCRTGDWKGGQEHLAKVSLQGPYGTKARVRRRLAAFTVQVGSYSDEARARERETVLKKVAAGAAVRSVEGERPLFVVSSGSFPRYDEAQREAERLKKLGFADAFVIP
jgi:tetratricopeptide (TPR) repeat protein